MARRAFHFRLDRFFLDYADGAAPPTREHDTSYHPSREYALRHLELEWSDPVAGLVGVRVTDARTGAVIQTVGKTWEAK